MLQQTIIILLSVIIGYVLAFVGLRTKQCNSLCKQALQASKGFFGRKPKCNVISPQRQAEAKQEQANKLPHPTDDIK